MLITIADVRAALLRASVLYGSQGVYSGPDRRRALPGHVHAGAGIHPHRSTRHGVRQLSVADLGWLDSGYHRLRADDVVGRRDADEGMGADARPSWSRAWLHLERTEHGIANPL